MAIDHGATTLSPLGRIPTSLGPCSPSSMMAPRELDTPRCRTRHPQVNSLSGASWRTGSHPRAEYTRATLLEEPAGVDVIAARARRPRLRAVSPGTRSETASIPVITLIGLHWRVLDRRGHHRDDLSRGPALGGSLIQLDVRLRATIRSCRDAILLHAAAHHRAANSGLTDLLSGVARSTGSVMVIAAADEGRRWQS